MVLTGQHSCNKWNLAYGRKGAGLWKKVFPFNWRIVIMINVGNI